MQRETLVRRAAAAEAEAALARTVDATSSSLKERSTEATAAAANVIGAVAAEHALAKARSELDSARRELAVTHEELEALRSRLADDAEDRRRVEHEWSSRLKQSRQQTEVAVDEAAKARAQSRAEATAVAELEAARNAAEKAERRAKRIDGRRRELEEEVEIAGKRARLREEDVRNLESRLEVRAKRRVFKYRSRGGVFKVSVSSLWIDDARFQKVFAL